MAGIMGQNRKGYSGLCQGSRIGKKITPRGGERGNTRIHPIRERGRELVHKGGKEGSEGDPTTASGENEKKKQGNSRIFPERKEGDVR